MLPCLLHCSMISAALDLPHETRDGKFGEPAKLLLVITWNFSFHPPFNYHLVGKIDKLKQFYPPTLPEETPSHKGAGLNLAAAFYTYPATISLEGASHQKYVQSILCSLRMQGTHDLHWQPSRKSFCQFKDIHFASSRMSLIELINPNIHVQLYGGHFYRF